MCSAPLKTIFKREFFVSLHKVRHSCPHTCGRAGPLRHCLQMHNWLCAGSCAAGLEGRESGSRTRSCNHCFMLLLLFCYCYGFVSGSCAAGLEGGGGSGSRGAHSAVHTPCMHTYERAHFHVVFSHFYVYVQGSKGHACSHYSCNLFIIVD